MASTIYPVFSHTQAQQTGQVEIFVDSDAEIATLSTDYAPGSTAIVCDVGAPTYILSPSKLWKQI